MKHIIKVMFKEEDQVGALDIGPVFIVDNTGTTLSLGGWKNRRWAQEFAQQLGLPLEEA